MNVREDDEGVRGEDAGAAPWAVRWAELERVGLQTTDQGPFDDDVFWLLHTASGIYRVPQGAPGEGRAAGAAAGAPRVRQPGRERGDGIHRQPGMGLLGARGGGGSARLTLARAGAAGYHSPSPYDLIPPRRHRCGAPARSSSP
jgi:hypothetical protein